METVGVICEYHLFHYGHQRQLDWIRSQVPGAVVVSIMSGNFVQRGEPALLDAYTRASLAVQAGADLVLELPFPYAMAGATYFAKGAVRLCDALGLSALCFGCESAVDTLLQMKENLCHPDFCTKLQQERDLSLSLAQQRSVCYQEMYGTSLTVNPNDMLAIEYLIALQSCRHSIKPFPLVRVGEWSATKLRRAYAEGDLQTLRTMAPKAIIDSLPPYEKTAQMERLFRPALFFLRTTPQTELSAFAEMTKDSAASFVRAAQSAQSMSDLLQQCQSKRYSRARLRRMLLSAMLGILEEDLRTPPSFTTLLAANERGLSALKTLHKQSQIPILTKPAHVRDLPGEAQRAVALQTRAQQLYTLATETVGSYVDFLTKTPYLSGKGTCHEKN